MKKTVSVIIKPLITEKSTIQKDVQNQIVLKVDPGANKIDIGRAVEEAFKVKVLKVRTMNMQGKKKRLGRHQGKRSDWKKAIVTLALGERIEFFEGV
jgi:large subunit ribosomal protein L23